MDSARAMFSKAVRVSSRLQSWKIKPSRSRRKRVSSLPRSFVSSWPSTWMEPEVGRSMVEMQFNRVVLPEPEAPMMPTVFPRRQRQAYPVQSPGGRVPAAVDLDQIGHLQQIRHAMILSFWPDSSGLNCMRG